ncbi:MAG: PhnD/SsuA/transferrin family substrate-binding protein [Desulfuromonadaceae bacterium]
MLLVSDVAFNAHTPLRFAPQPLMSQQHMIEKFSALCNALAKICGQEVELVYKSDYADIIKGISENSIDFAILGPLPFVFATEDNSHILPLVRILDESARPDYTCALVSFGNKNPLDKKNAIELALTQPYATCGYLMTEALLDRYDRSLEQLPYIYAGTHEKAALAVIGGDADLAGIKTSVAHKYSNLGLNILCESEFVPGFVLVANSETLDKEKLGRISSELLKIKPRPLPENLNYGMIPFDNQDYDIIRYMLEKYPVPDIPL